MTDEEWPRKGTKSAKGHAKGHEPFGICDAEIAAKAQRAYQSLITFHISHFTGFEGNSLAWGVYEVLVGSGFWGDVFPIS
jgi:hypothetical protein